MQTEDILNDFYNAFGEGNKERMLRHYHPDATFQDPAFGKLKGKEVLAMWSMLIEKSKGELEIAHRIIESDQSSGKVIWEAKYNYGKSRRKVHNIITADITLQDDKIIKHVDEFNLWKWSGQALGLPGKLLGWSSYLQNKIQRGAKKSLAEYMSK